jgi:hypothetical protein
MIDLHERLSEYSYGYGITRETEKLLKNNGIRAVPFLPNLIQEKDLGFDVGFNRPGVALLFQFKLGHSLKVFRRTDLSVPPPILDRPYWRFNVDTAEPDGQFETLLKAEQDGAETYYIAPRFSDWAHYAELFDQETILDSSLLIRPSEIRTALVNKGDPDGPHRIVYDRYGVHVCSKHVQIEEVNGDTMISKVASAVRERKEAVGVVLNDIFKGFDNRMSVRRQKDTKIEDLAMTGSEMGYRSTGYLTQNQRARRFEKLLSRAQSRDQAVAATVGLELWALGIQLIVAVDPQ